MSWFTTLKNTALWFVVEWQLFFSMGWHNAGSRQVVKSKPDDRRTLIAFVCHFPYRDQDVSVTAVYTPHSNRVGDKRAYYTQCQLQHRELRDAGCVQLGGDFNGHVARGDGPSPHCLVRD